MRITCNGHDCEAGLVLDGHWGWHNHARMIAIAVALGFEISADDQALIDRYDDSGADLLDDNAHEVVTSIMDDAEQWLNDNTTGGTWGWDDGEFFLEHADDPDISYVWVCTDCYFAHHQGVTFIDGTNPDDPDGPTSAEWFVGDSDAPTPYEPLARLDREHFHVEDAVDQERRFGDTGEQDFSHSHCEGCDSPLAGSRHRLAMWPDERAQEAYLTTMFQGYVECALWSSVNYDEDGVGSTFLDQNFDIDDIGGLSTLAMSKDCEDFMKSNWSSVCDLDPAQVGHDFWLTRNRHGAGFWDRGLGQLGQYLTDVAHAYGEADLILGDDGVIEYHG